jgi:hypothetical protein
MPGKRVPTPQETIKVRRLPAKGDRIPVTVEVTRVGRNSFDTADTITIRLPGHSTPVTVNADLLLGSGDD